jgi:hypothetical protein
LTASFDGLRAYASAPIGLVPTWEKSERLEQ